MGTSISWIPNYTSCKTWGHEILVTKMRNDYLVQLVCRIALVFSCVHTSPWVLEQAFPLYLSKEFQGACEISNMANSILHVCVKLVQTFHLFFKSICDHTEWKKKNQCASRREQKRRTTRVVYNQENLPEHKMHISYWTTQLMWVNLHRSKSKNCMWHLWKYSTW